jgi:membrane-bound lytic murein transglycosylase D
MYHQRKLAVAISATLAISALSGCSTNHNVTTPSSYQKNMGDVEFKKAAHLLLKTNKPHPLKYKVRKATYRYNTNHRIQKAYRTQQKTTRFQKTAYHPSRTPRTIGIITDLEKAAAELLGSPKKISVQDTTYRPIKLKNNDRPKSKDVYSNIYIAPAGATKQSPYITKEQNSTPIQHKASRAGHDDMWKRIYRGQKIKSYANHPSVRRFIRSYSRNPTRINRIAKRASKYLFMVVTELERRNMPTELALLPFVESAYLNTARSHASAAGMWQFIPSTGRLYGLKQKRGYDGRMDSFEATRAALDYLQKLNKEFHGDWFLSLAAYNAGEGRVQRAINYNRRKGRPTDYWSLRLPKETRQYVPRLLAYKEIIRNPKRYGIHLPRASSRPALTTIWVNKKVNLRKAAKRAGLPATTLTALNPSYLRGITTPRYSKRIILPIKHAARLQRVIKGTVKPSYRYVNKGYSKRYKTTKGDGKRIITHRVRRGETLYKIAMRHGTTVKSIMRMNKLRSSRVRAGKRIKVASKYKRYSYS